MNLTPSRQAIIAALEASQDLSNLLGVDPADKTKPAIFSTQRVPPPVYPCITYAFTSVSPDPRFTPTAAETAISGVGEGSIHEFRCELRAYDKGKVSRRDLIVEAVKTTLVGQVLSLTTGTLFRVEMLAEIHDQWDSFLNASFVILRLRLLYSA